jgi:hypothetical protein
MSFWVLSVYERSVAAHLIDVLARLNKGRSWVCGLG